MCSFILKGHKPERLETNVLDQLFSECFFFFFFFNLYWESIASVSCHCSCPQVLWIYRTTPGFLYSTPYSSLLQRHHIAFLHHLYIWPLFLTLLFSTHPSGPRRVWFHSLIKSTSQTEAHKGPTTAGNHPDSSWGKSIIITITIIIFRWHHYVGYASQYTP